MEMISVEDASQVAKDAVAKTIRQSRLLAAKLAREMADHFEPVKLTYVAGRRI